MSMNWACLKQQKFNFGSYSLIPIQREHIESIRIYRNEQLNILRQNSPITFKQQKLYFSEQVWPLMPKKNPPNILMSFLYKDQLIGYGGLVHISWENLRAELSFLVSHNRANKKDQYSMDFRAFLNLIKELAFSDLEFHRLFTETFDNDQRVNHIKILEEFGFKREGIMIDHVKINNKFSNSIFHGLIRG